MAPIAERDAAAIPAAEVQERTPEEGACSCEVPFAKPPRSVVGLDTVLPQLVGRNYDIP